MSDVVRGGRVTVSAAVLSGIALVLALPSLLYPFGRDQGLFYYVGREWALRGAIPYRDVLDHKTPGIYIVHMLLVRVFGEQMWACRLLDAICVACIAMLVAELTAVRGEAVRSGVRPVAAVVTAMLFYGYLTFWDSAQTETYYTLFSLCAVVAAERFENETKSALLAGACSGAALLMKPPAMTLVLLAFAILVLRAWSMRDRDARFSSQLVRLGRPVALFCSGGAAVVAVVMAYFAANQALPAMYEILVGAQGHYVQYERNITSLGDVMRAVLGYHWYCFPLVPLACGYVVVALFLHRRARSSAGFRRHALAVAAGVAGFSAVLMQGKFYFYHWTPVIPATALFLTNAYCCLEDALKARGVAWPAVALFVPALFVAWSGTMVSMASIDMWRLGAVHGVRYLTRNESRDEFTDHFQVPLIGYSYRNSEHVGRWLNAHSTPQDTIAVRGFQPEIYAVAHRRHEGRFFWTTFITNPARMYKRAEWLKEDRDALVAHPPRYVVALTMVESGPDSPAYFRELGYEVVEVMGEFTILQPATH